MRFRWSDPVALAREIGEASGALAFEHLSGNVPAEIELGCRLSVALTAADRETEAVALLAARLIRARELGNPALIAWTLHYLATAEQYCGDHDSAQAHFGEALNIVVPLGLRDTEHFIWRHRGCCYAEQGYFPEARRCFERALAIRDEIDQTQVEKTRQALAALDTLSREMSLGEAHKQTWTETRDRAEKRLGPRLGGARRQSSRAQGERLRHLE